MANSSLDNLENNVASVLSQINNSLSTLNYKIEEFNDDNDYSIALQELNTDIIIDYSKLGNEKYLDASEFITARSKDFVLLSDQADQFICVALDTFSRIVDTHVYINNGLEYHVNESASIISNHFKQLTSYIIDNYSETDSFIEAEINRVMLICDNEYLTLCESFIGILNIGSKIRDTLKLFEDVLFINTTVGVALSVSDRAWGEMVALNTLNYKEETNKLPVDISTEESDKLEDNLYYKSDSRLFDKINQDLLILLSDNIIFNIDPLYTISILNVYKNSGGASLDTTFSSLDFGKSFNHSIPIQFKELLSDIEFVKQLVITDDILSEYWDNLSVDDQLLQSKENFISDGTSDDISSNILLYTSEDIISIFIDNFKFNTNLSNLSNYLYDKFNYNVNNVKQLKVLSLFNDDPSDTYNKHILFDDFIKSLRAQYSLTSSYASEHNYRELDYCTNKLSNTQYDRNGSISIMIYKDNKPYKQLETIKYDITFTKNDFFVTMAKIKYNDISAQIDNGVMELNYYISSFVNDIEVGFDNKSVIYQKYEINNQLFGNNLDNIIIDYKEIQNNIEESRLNESKIIDNIVYQSSKIDDKYHITKTLDRTLIIFEWISDNKMERVVTRISNVYRKALIEGKMDMANARTNSILKSLEYFDIRNRMERFIDDTWNVKIPRANREKE